MLTLTLTHSVTEQEYNIDNIYKVCGATCVMHFKTLLKILTLPDRF